MKASIPAFVSLGLAVGLCTACIVKRPLAQSVIRSTLIFEGTVQQTGRSLEPEFLPSSADTYVVRVEKVYTDREQFGEFVGTDVTVLLVSDSPIKGDNIRSKSRFVFLTSPVLYANTLAVEGEAYKSEPVVIRTVDSREQLRLLRRVELAHLIVTGSVQSVRPLRLMGDDPKSSIPVADRSEFEHDPDWQEATIAITQTLKGRSVEKTIRVLFPSSTDIAWFRSPRYSVRQRGTWLLQNTPLDLPNKSALTALDPLDFHPGDKPPQILEKGSQKSSRAKRESPTQKEASVR